MIMANGITDMNFDFFAKPTPKTYFGFNIFPESLQQSYEENGCVIPNPFIPRVEITAECLPIIQKMAKLHNTGVDIYDLLRMPDTSIFTQEVENETFSNHNQARSAVGALESYLNRPDVRVALHIPDYV